MGLTFESIYKFCSNGNKIFAIEKITYAKTVFNWSNHGSFSCRFSWAYHLCARTNETRSIRWAALGNSVWPNCLAQIHLANYFSISWEQRVVEFHWMCFGTYVPLSRGFRNTPRDPPNQWRFHSSGLAGAYLSSVVQSLVVFRPMFCVTIPSLDRAFYCTPLQRALNETIRLVPTYHPISYNLQMKSPKKECNFLLKNIKQHSLLTDPTHQILNLAGWTYSMLPDVIDHEVCVRVWIDRFIYRQFFRTVR